jgi:rubrerythrin
MAIGYLYVLHNPTMPSLLKVGYTCSSVDKRRRELSGSTGVPREFVTEYFHLTEDVEDVESKVHETLADSRFGENREFFAASLETVIAAIQKHVSEPVVRFQRPGSSQVTVSPDYECHRCGHRYERTSAQNLCPVCGF